MSSSVLNSVYNIDHGETEQKGNREEELCFFRNKKGNKVWNFDVELVDLMEDFRVRGRELRGFWESEEGKGRLIKCNFHGRERGRPGDAEEEEEKQ